MESASDNPAMSNKARGRAEGKRNPLTPRQYCCTGGLLRDRYGNPAPECCVWPKPADCKNCPDEERRFNFVEFDWKMRHPKGGIRIEPQGCDAAVIFLDSGVFGKKEFFRLPVRKSGDSGGWQIVCCQKDRRNLAVLQ